MGLYILEIIEGKIMKTTVVDIVCKSLKETETTVKFMGGEVIYLRKKVESSLMDKEWLEVITEGCEVKEVYLSTEYQELVVRSCVRVEKELFLRWKDIAITEGITENELKAVVNSLEYILNVGNIKKEFCEAYANLDMDKLKKIVSRSLEGYSDLIKGEEIENILKHSILKAMNSLIRGTTETEVRCLEILIKMYGYYLWNSNRVIYLLFG